MKLKIKTIKNKLMNLGYEYTTDEGKRIPQTFKHTRLFFVDKEPKCYICGKKIPFDNFAWFRTRNKKFFCIECDKEKRPLELFDEPSSNLPGIIKKRS